MLGTPSLVMSYTDFRLFLGDFFDDILSYIQEVKKEETKIPSFQELKDYAYGFLEGYFMSLKEKGLEQIVIFFPLKGTGSGVDAVFVDTPEDFLDLIDREENLEDWYSEILKEELGKNLNDIGAEL